MSDPPRPREASAARDLAARAGGPRAPAQAADGGLASTDCLPDPSQRLTAAYHAAAARMAGLGVVNPALEVDAVGFAPWEEHWLGVMVTPWSMNLMLLPRNPRSWQPLAVGAKRRYAFPAGEFEFVGGSDPELGAYQVCSLFSPVHEFADHATARLVATLARAALLDSANAPAAEAPAGKGRAASRCTHDGPLARLERRLDAPLSKRAFLRGRFLGVDDDDRG
jgi:[NiFe] hydrogenase assembly HybE family chaperone